MNNDSRLPRKLKKQMKKNGEWTVYKEKERQKKEKRDSIDVIFTRDYTNSHKTIRKIIKTGR